KQQINEQRGFAGDQGPDTPIADAMPTYRTDRQLFRLRQRGVGHEVAFRSRKSRRGHNQSNRAIAATRPPTPTVTQAFNSSPTKTTAKPAANSTGAKLSSGISRIMSGAASSAE